jgi:recombination protein RecR
MKIFDRFISALRRLPGVGPRQAERFATYFLRSSVSQTEEFISALRELKSSIRLCKRCYDFSREDICPICSDTSRDSSLLCVVEEPQNIEAIEKTKSFNGFYHVLHGSISPIDGVGVDSLKINELLGRIKDSDLKIQEVIVATDPDTEGESTALYLADLLREYVPNITRIAYGVPLGGDLNYIDELTLGYSLKGRKSI